MQTLMNMIDNGYFEREITILNELRFYISEIRLIDHCSL